jgi:hypothetical protein
MTIMKILFVDIRPGVFLKPLPRDLPVGVTLGRREVSS